MRFPGRLPDTQWTDGEVGCLDGCFGGDDGKIARLALFALLPLAVLGAMLLHPFAMFAYIRDGKVDK